MALRVGLVGAKPLGKEWSEQDGEFIRERGKEMKMVVRQEKRNKNVCRVTFRTNYSNRVICSHFHGGEARLPETGWVRTKACYSMECHDKCRDHTYHFCGDLCGQTRLSPST